MQQQIRDRLSNYRKHLVLIINKIKHRYSQTRRRTKLLLILLVTILVSLIIAVLTLNAINLARPGDYWFTAKLFKEGSRESLNYKQAKALFFDRVKAADDLAANNNCIQLVVAESEVKQTASLVLKIIDKQSDKFQELANEMPHYTFETNCVVNFSGEQIHSLFTLAAGQVGDWGQDERQKLDQTLVELSSKLASQKEQIRSWTASDQMELNRRINLLEKAILALKGLTDDSKATRAQFYVTIAEINIAIERVEELLKQSGAPTDVFSPWLDYANLMCHLRTTFSADCVGSGIESGWNSINAIPNEADRLQPATKQFTTYLTDFVANKSIETK